MTAYELFEKLKKLIDVDEAYEKFPVTFKDQEIKSMVVFENEDEEKGITGTIQLWG